jgi:hypothetical protein
LLIGRSNSGTAVTTLTNSAGTPLSLRAKTGYPPLLVNSSKPVTNLNADWIDGINGVNLVQRTGPYMATTGNVQGTSFWAAPDSTSDTIISVAECPAGTKLTGGGFYDGTSTGFTYGNFPDTNAWVVIVGVSSSHGVNDVPESVESYAVCYNPRGPVAGGQTNGFTAKSVGSLSPATQEKIDRAVDRARSSR